MSNSNHQFSFYQTYEGLLYKTICQLVEKSYQSSLKITILVPNVEVQEELNKILWTYTRKYFIPHGSQLDPYPEKQPIYITDRLENPNNASVLMIIAPTEMQVILADTQYIENFQRIITVYEVLENLPTITNSSVDYYMQNPTGGWAKR